VRAAARSVETAVRADRARARINGGHGAPDWVQRVAVVV
jgi:hypothetical protein